MSITVKAKAFKSMYHNNGFDIISFSPITPYSEELKLGKYMTFSCKGDLSWVSIGKEYELELEELETNMYGTSYKIISCPTLSLDLEKLTLEQSKEILMEFTTERQANSILEAYPNFIYKVITEGKESIDTKLIYGVGEAYLNAYARELNTRYKYFGIIDKIKQWDIDISDCKALLDHYINEQGIITNFEKYPYECLISVLKRPFEKADRAVMELRPDLRYSEQRCAYLMLNVLERNELDGSTRLNGNLLYNYILNEYPQGQDIKDLIVDVAKNNELFYYDEATADLSIRDTYLAECRIAELAKEKNLEPTILDIDLEKYREVDGFALTDEQFNVLENFCKYDFLILCGKSGSGKTSSMKALVKLMEDNHMTYTLLTPTGTASLRLKDQTCRPTSTIHRKVLRDKTISTDVIVIDEMSMVGLDVFMMLINAIDNPNCKIVLAGDVYQIPSISKGCVFGDLIDSNIVPKTELTKVFRYDTSGGAFVGENIRQGKQFLNDPRVKIKDNIYTICDNYKFVQTSDIFDNVITEYAKLRKKYKANEIMILSAYNVGDCGTYKLNNTIELEYNPPKPNEQTMSYKKGTENIVFRVGTRVVNTKNNYKALPLESYEKILNSDGLLTEEDVPTTELFNGQVGVVRNIIDEKALVCQFGEELIVIDKGHLQDLLLAWAISTYRAQGSEYKAIINVISPSQAKNLSRNLLYVSDTRGKEYHCDIGDKETFEKSLLVDIVKQRNTWLRELLTIEED